MFKTIFVMLMTPALPLFDAPPALRFVWKSESFLPLHSLLLRRTSSKNKGGPHAVRHDQ